MKYHYSSNEQFTSRMGPLFAPDQGGGGGGAEPGSGEISSSSGTIFQPGSGGSGLAGTNAGAGPQASSAGTGSGAAPATDAASSAGTGWLKDESGVFAEGWVDRLPKELRGNASLKVLPSLEALAKSYVETKRMVGTRLEVPGEKATPEQIAAWRKVMGAPERPEGYAGEQGTLRPEGIPAALWDPAGEQQFLAVAHKHHLPPAAVKDILGLYGSQLSHSLQQAQAQEGVILGQETARLRQTWGQEYDSNLHLAARVAQTVGLDPQSHPIFTSAEVVRAFARMGRLLSEDRLVTGQVRGVMSSAQDRIQDITDPRSTSTLAREYRGEYGADRQRGAQEQLHQLYASART